MTITDPTADSGRRTTQQWILTGVGASGMMAGLAIIFFAPQVWYLLALAGVLLAVGVAVGVVALLRAVRLIADEGPLRTLGFLSLFILIGDPLLMTLVGILV